MDDEMEADRIVYHRVTWKINHYRSKEKAGDAIISPKLTVIDPLTGKELAFSMMLFPKVPPTHLHGPSVGLFLQNLGEDVCVGYRLFVLNGLEEEAVEMKRETMILKKKDSEGWMQFCSRDKFETNEVVVFGAVTFGCEFKLVLPRFQSDELNKKLFSAKRNDNLTDLELVCRGQRFPCHKFVISTHSGVLRKRIDRMAKDTCGKIVISDLEPEAVDRLLEFLYTSRIDTSGSSRDIEELFLAACIYDVTDLKMETAQALLNMLHHSNVAYALMTFDRLNRRELKGFRAATLRYAAEHLPLVVESIGWQKWGTRSLMREICDEQRKNAVETD